MSSSGPKNVVLLAAGSGSRLAPLTDSCHKSLLQIAGKAALGRILDHTLAAGAEDVVVVVGHRRTEIENFLAENYGDFVRCAVNERYKDDVNILSVDVGVEALKNPATGYMIIETDLVVEPKGWDKILDTEKNERSFWVTRGRYSRELTGGIVRVDDEGNVREVAYKPQYDERYEGWQKMLGILYVSPAQVAADRRLRKASIQESISQYYMMPWLKNIDLLPCVSRDIGGIYAASYNDVVDYMRVDREYRDIDGTEGTDLC